jgi:DNA-binding transcriptional MerR regulator
MSTHFSIGELSRATGCKIPTIRYYEQIGLMPEPARTQGNQRRYGAAHLARLSLIRHCRELGFGLDTVRDLLALAQSPGESCAAADQAARRQLRAINRKIESLMALRTELERMVEACGGGTVEDCRVMDILTDHSKCLAERH